MKKIGFVLLMASALFLHGCFDFFEGGGWAWSSFDPTQKVTFGVKGTCTQAGDDALIDLELTWHDHGFPAGDVYQQNRNNKKHMAIVAHNPEPWVWPDATCDEIPSGFDPADDFGLPGYAGFQLFYYCPQGVDSGEDCGEAGIVVYDTQSNGPDKGDRVFLMLEGGWYDGYQSDPISEAPEEEEFAEAGLVLEGGNITVTVQIGDTDQ